MINRRKGWLDRYKAFVEKEDVMLSLEGTYCQAIKISQNIVEDIRFGRKLYLDPIDAISAQICKYRNEDTNILTLLSNFKDKNPYLISHPVNVAFISFIIGIWLDLKESKLLNLVKAALLLDIGKAKIKDSLLNKPEELTLEEVEKLKAHPVISYKILHSTGKFDMEILSGVLFHHERVDGTGYPIGLKGENINLISRIIAVADTFDAITSDKAYGKKYSPLQAIQEIMENGIGLDQEIFRVFVSHMINYYCDREVLLSNERLGHIVSFNYNNISKPLVNCDDEYIDLAAEKDIEIVEIH